MRSNNIRIVTLVFVVFIFAFCLLMLLSSYIIFNNVVKFIQNLTNMVDTAKTQGRKLIKDANEVADIAISKGEILVEKGEEIVNNTMREAESFINKGEKFTSLVILEGKDLLQTIEDIRS